MVCIVFGILVRNTQHYYDFILLYNNIRYKRSLNWYLMHNEVPLFNVVFVYNDRLQSLVVMLLLSAV